MYDHERQNYQQISIYQSSGPGQFLSVVQDASHQLIFQTYKKHKLLCDLEQADSLSEVMEGRRKITQCVRFSKARKLRPNRGIE